MTNLGKRPKRIYRAISALLAILTAGWFFCGWYENSLYFDVWSYAKSNAKSGFEAPVEVKGRIYLVPLELQLKLQYVHRAEVLIGVLSIPLFFFGHRYYKASGST